MSEELTKEQIDRITHMTGLSYRKMPYRNYYCAGRERMEEMDDLCDKGLMLRRERGSDDFAPQWYYYLTDNGLDYILKHKELFKLDRRIKTLSTLIEKCNF